MTQTSLLMPTSSDPSPDLPAELGEALDQARRLPQDPTAWLRVDERVREFERPDEASALYLECLERDLPTATLLTIGEQAVAFHEEWYAKPDKTIGILKRLTRVDPGSEWAFERLSLLLTMDERWDELLSEYDHVLAHPLSGPRRRRLLDEAARVAKDFAGQSARASAYLKQQLLAEPSNDQLAESLERRLEQQGRHEDLIEIWHARLPFLSPAEAMVTRVQIAERHLHPLGNAERSLKVTEEILSLPEGEGPAVDLLERIAASTSAAAPARRRSLGLLRHRYAAAERAEDVIRVLRTWLTVAENTEATLELHESARQWLVRSGRWAEALVHAAARLELLPEDGEVHGQLKELAERTGLFDQYVTALIAAADGCSAGRRRVELLLEAGQVAERALGNRAQATDLLLRVLADADASADAQLAAARQARPLLTGTERTQALLHVLERLADLEPGVGSQREVLAEAARLAESHDQLDRALSLWQRCLDHDGSDLEALGARIALLERAGRFEALIGDLRRRSQLHQLPGDQRADCVRIALLYENELRRLGSAIDVWRDLEGRFGSNTETIDALVRLCQADGRYDDVIARLGSALDTELPAERRTTYLSLLGDVFRMHRHEPEHAVDYYRQALAADVTHAAARAGLRDLLKEPRCAAQAVECLAEALLRADEWRAVLELLPERIALSDDRTLSLAIWCEAADLQEHRAGDLRACLEYLCQAFLLEPSQELEAQIERVATASGNYGQAVQGLSAAIERMAMSERKLELHLTRGRLLETELGQREAALADYQAILGERPADTQAASASARVAIELGEFTTLARTFVRHTEANGQLDPALVAAVEGATHAKSAWPDVSRALLQQLSGRVAATARVEHDLRRQLGVWFRDHRADPIQASALLLAAVEHERSRDTLELLAELQRADPGRALVTTLLALAEVTDEDLEVLHEAATVAKSAGLDAPTVRAILIRTRDAAAKRLLGGDGTESRAAAVAWWSLQNLVALEVGAGAPEAAIELLLTGADLPFAGAQAVALRYQAAEIAARSLPEATRSVAICRDILQREPNHPQSIALLGNLLEQEERFEELLALRRAELDLGPPLERRLALRLDETRVLRRLGRGRHEQLRALRRNLEEAPGNSESMDQLEALLLSRASHAVLFRVLCAQAEQVTAAGRREAGAQLWARAGMLSEAALANPSQAIAALEQSASIAAYPSTLDALARLYVAEHRPADAVSALQKRLDLTAPDGITERRTTLGALARALCDAGREGEARSRLADALTRDPGALDLRQLLGELYRTSGDYVHLAPLLVGGVDYAPDSATRVAFLREAARVHRQQLGDLHTALPLLQQAVLLDPEDRTLRLSLADGLRQADRLDEARGLLQHLLEEFGRRRTPERARVHYQLAQIARRVGDLETALRELNLAASVDRNDLHMLKLLGDVARERGKLEEAERAYRTLLLLLGRSRQQESEDRPVIGESSVLFELYRIAIERGQAERAKELLDSALEAGAHDDAEAKRLEQALREAGHHDLLLRALEQRLHRTAEPQARGLIQASRGDVLESLGRFDDALDCRLDAIRCGIVGPELLRQTWQVAERVEKSPQMVDLIDQVAGQAVSEHPERACRLWLAVGTLCLDSSDAQAASRLLTRAQSTGFFAYETLAQIERIGPARQSPETLSNGLRLFVETADSSEQPDKYTDVLYRLGALELALGQAEQGALRLETALGRNQDYARGIALLRGAMSEGAVPIQVAELLEGAARKQGDEPALLLALGRRAELGEITAEGLQEAVLLARKLSDASRLQQLLERTVTLAQEQGWMDDAVWAIHDLVESFKATGNRAGAIALLDQGIGATSAAPSFELKLELAALLAEEAGDLARAAELYEQLLAEEPSAPRVWKPLLAVYRKRGDQQSLERRILALEESLGESEQRRALRLERLKLLLDSGRSGEAEADLQRLIVEDPASDEIAEVLEQLLATQGRTGELQASIEHRLAAARDRQDHERVTRLTLRLADLLDSTDPGAALSIFRLSAESGTRTPTLLKAYLDLLGRTGQGTTDERVHVLLSLLGQESGAQAEARALELAALHSARDDQAGIEAALQKGLERVPTSAALHERWVAWCSQHGRFGELAQHLVTKAQHEPSPRLAAELYVRAAELYEGPLDSPEQAAAALTRAIDPSRPQALLHARIAHAHAQAGQSERALEHYSAAVDAHLERDSTWAHLLQQRAAVRLRLDSASIDSVTQAVQDLTRAAQLDPGQVSPALAEALELQCRILEQSDGDAAVEALRRSTIQLTSVLAQLSRRDEALIRLRAWLGHHPQDTDALQRLALLAAETGDAATAIDAYQALVPLVTGPQQVDAALRLAAECERAGDAMTAKAALEQVHQSQPAEGTIRRRLRQIYEQARAYSDWARLVMAEAESAEVAPSERFDLLCNAGDLFLQSEGSLADARSALERALELKPDSVQALVKIVDTQVRLGEIEQAAGRLDEAIRQHGRRRSPELAELQYAMARVARAAGDEEAVFAWLEAALYSDRQNGAVAAELASLAMSRGELDVAIKALQLVTLLKTPGPMSRAEAYLRQAAIAKHRGDVKKAALLAKRAITTDPEYGEAQTFLDELGRLYSTPPPSESRQ